MLEKAVDQAIETLRAGRQRYERAAERQSAVWRGEAVDTQPLLLSCDLPDDYPQPPGFDLAEIQESAPKMFSRGLREMLAVWAADGEGVPSVRANMGCGIFPSLLGVEQRYFPDKMPWVVEHLSKEQLTRLEPDDIVLSDSFQRGLDFMAYMAERLEGSGCLVFPMDLQGAFDTAHLVYGDQIFYDLYDDPPFLHHLLQLCCAAIFQGLAACLEIIPHSDHMVAHYNSLVFPRELGGIKISEDTSTLLSPEHIEEFVLPYIRQILGHFGGGYVHYCERNDYLFDKVVGEPLVRGLNFGNPDYHDMGQVLAELAAHHKIYYGFVPRQEGESHQEYFQRVLAASECDERRWLLLQYRVELAEKEAVRRAWRQAQGSGV